MVFCNKKEDKILKKYDVCHNPYFNRWFSAIDVVFEGKEPKKTSQSLF